LQDAPLGLAEPLPPSCRCLFLGTGYFFLLHRTSWIIVNKYWPAVMIRFLLPAGNFLKEWVIRTSLQTQPPLRLHESRPPDLHISPAPSCHTGQPGHPPAPALSPPTNTFRRTLTGDRVWMTFFFCYSDLGVRISEIIKILFNC
jgi:hypothetical protein